MSVVVCRSACKWARMAQFWLIKERISPLYRPVAARFASDDATEDSKHKEALLVSLFKNPIVHQLWTARKEAKARRGGGSKEDVSEGKTPSESRVEVSYPFSTDELLQEAYRNPWGQMRLGKMMEDLDALAGNIAFFHVDTGEQDLPIIVTASVDRISLRERPDVRDDQTLSGQVTWTGTSSMEIRMQCTDESSSDNEWLEAYVTFVTLDASTKKPTKIPPILPQTEEEKSMFEQGAARAATKKRRRKQHKSPEASNHIDDMAQELLAEAGPLLNMPSLADPHTILMQSTRMQNAMIAQPQVQNLHNRIFGGFLMRRAFELSFANAYVFGGSRPVFLEVDEVSFASPVDVGDLLVFNSRVLYTEEGQLSDYYESMSPSPSPAWILHIEVEAWVTEPENASARMSNQFYFTFAIQKQVRRVLPSNIDEARRMALRMVADQEQEKQE